MAVGFNAANISESSCGLGDGTTSGAIPGVSATWEILGCVSALSVEMAGVEHDLGSTFVVAGPSTGEAGTRLAVATGTELLVGIFDEAEITG
jgi:hypothetical protein